MLIDTHCHLNMMIKTDFDMFMTPEMIEGAKDIIDEAAQWNVARIINVGTSLIESKNSVLLADRFEHIWATIGIHPNDCTKEWNRDLKQLGQFLQKGVRNKVVGIGECGIDRHYPDFNLQRQVDAFRAHIEMALEYDLALVVHSRDAYDETLRVLEEYVKNDLRAVMHCFSYDQMFANQVIEWGFLLGLGGTITYPKNNELRVIAQGVDLQCVILETDAPFLPPQIIRGKQNHPKYIKTIAEYLAALRGESYQTIADVTTQNALKLFSIAS